MPPNKSFAEQVRAIREDPSRKRKISDPDWEASLLRGLSQSGFFSRQEGDVEQSRLQGNPNFTPMNSMSDARYAESRDRLRNRPLGEQIPAATGGLGKSMENIGRDLPMVAAAAPLVAAGGLPAVAAELLVGTGALGVREIAREMGGGTGTQTAAELLTAIAVPGTIVSKAPKVARRIATNPAAYSKAAEFAAKHSIDLPPEVLDRAAAELKRKISRDPIDPERRIREVSENLGRDIEAFGGPDGTGVTPSLSQSAGESGGRNLYSLEADMARKNQDYAAESIGRSQNIRDQLGVDAASGRPAGGYETVEAVTDETLEAMTRETQAAWDAVPFDEMPYVDTADLNSLLDELAEEVGEGYEKHLPDEFFKIREAGGQATVKEIQRWRSNLLALRRHVKKSASPSFANEKRSANAGRLIEQLTKEIDRIGDAGGDSLKNALALTRRDKEMFSPAANPFWDQMGLKGQRSPRKAVGAVKRNVDPVSAARAAKATLGDSEEGLSALRGVFWDDLLGDQFGDRSYKQIENALRDPVQREMYTEVFGAEGMEFVDQLSRRYQVAMRRSGGERGTAMATGTGLSEAAQVLSPASSANSILWGLSKSAGNWMRDKALSNKEIAHLLLEATQDSRLAKALLDIPAPRAEPAWRIILEKGYRKAKSRGSRQATRSAINDASDRISKKKQD